MKTETILHRLHSNARTRPGAPAYFEKAGEGWAPTSWSGYLAQVRAAARALIALGVETGDITAILGFNTPEWVIMDLAAMLVGGAAAGIYTTNSPSEVAYIIRHAQAKVVLLEDPGQWEKVKQVRTELPSLEHVVMMRKSAPIDDEMVMSWEAFMAVGANVPESAVDERLVRLEMDRLATLIYTSGTTGPPKGVMVSHENLAWTAKSGSDLLQLTPQESSLSYLPLSHMAEQMFTIHIPITAAYPVYFAESIEKLADNLREVQPTIVFGVPRIWERFHAGVTARLAEATGIRRRLITWAQGVGRQVSALRNQGREPGGLLAAQYGLAEKLVFSKLRPAMGLSRARYCLTGAAPINPEILEFFSGLDLIIHEVYGQSEDSGPTSINIPGATRFGTVGRPWPGLDVRIAPDGEILVRGPNVFMGYYKDPAATANDLEGGWLHSGDLGDFDGDGYLRIVGRKKEIMITAGGKNIAPKNIEAALANIPLVAEAVLIADRRRFVSALITLDEENAARFAIQHNLNGAALHDHPIVIAALQKEIDEQVNSQIARVEQVRKFTVLPRKFTIEAGELTPTLKIKRRVIHRNWADQIEAMYGGK